MNKKKLCLGLLASFGALSLIGCNTKPIETPDDGNTGNTETDTKYTVTFMNGETTVSTVSVKEGTKVTKPEVNPSKEGYDFKGWATSADSTIMYNFETAVNSAFTLYAVFEKQAEIIPTYTMSFVVDGNVFDTATVKKGEKLASIAAPEKEGYTFKCWSTSENGAAYDFEQAVTEVLTLYAVYEVKVDNLPEAYKEIISNASLVVYNNDFNSYKTTDKLSDFSSWGTKGLYQSLGAADGTVGVSLGNNNATLVNQNATVGAKLVLDYGNNINSGYVEGYFETTLADQDNSWTFVQFFGTATDLVDAENNAKTDEVFGIRIDSGVFKYRLNGGTATAEGVKNSVTAGNTTYKVYFKIDLDAHTVTMVIDGKEYVTDLSTNITSLVGMRFVTADKGMKKTQAVDNLAVRHVNLSDDEIKALYISQLTSKATELKSGLTEEQQAVLDSIVTSATTKINAATKAVALTEYNSAVTELNSQALVFVKAKYAVMLDSVVDQTKYTENINALSTAITAGKTAVNAATSVNEVIEAYNAAVTAIGAVDNDEQALAKLKVTLASELEAYKSEADYKTKLADLRAAVAAGKTAINNATSMELARTALLEAKASIDAIKSDADLLVDAKTSYKNEIATAVEAKITLINSNTSLSSDDKTALIAAINAIKTQASADIDAATTAVDAENVSTKALSDITSTYEEATLSLEAYKASLVSELSNLVAEKKQLDSLSDEDKTNIDSNKQSGTNAINAATTKAAAKTAFETSRDAILKIVKDALVSNINLISAAGDQESIYATWGINSEITTYNAYYKESSSSDWIKVTDSLIRTYPTYMRVDVVGLKVGSYDLKIVAVVEENEVESINVVAKNLTVISYDRTGFAFTKTSYYDSSKDGFGAYNMDGTLKSNARVLYVTGKTAKTVKLKVKVDSKGTEEEATGLQAILTKYEKGAEDRPLSIRVIGEITKDDMDSFGSSAEGLQIKGKSTELGAKYITFEGIGNDATIHGFGFLIKNCVNFELRNLAVMTGMDDDISLDGGNSNVWVHDNDLYYGPNGSGDHAKGDGALDIKGTFYATLSYNHYYDTGKSTLHSNSSSIDVDYVSYHHNWFDHSDSRHPRIRCSENVHIYNNYYDGIAKYGIGITNGGSAFVENNYFRNCKFPMMSSLMGSDIFAGTDTMDVANYATFSKEDSGILKSYGNVMVGNYTYIPYGCTSYVCKGTEVTYKLGGTTSTVDFDAYEAKTRNEAVPSTVVGKSNQKAYSNFDTNSSIMYSYNVQTPADAVTTVEAYAGRVGGGDFKWEFDDATEDTNYAVIPALRKAIDEYKGTLVGVKGDGSTITPTTPTEDKTYEQVIALINALPATIALTDETAINAAKAAYDALSEANKALVTNKSKLDDAITALNTLKGQSVSGTVTITFDKAKSSDPILTVVKANEKAGATPVTYNGVKYTTAIKMEGEDKTGLKLNLVKAATVTFVTDTASKSIKIDGNKIKTDANGILTIDLSAGEHTILKGDSMNLYAVIVTYK